MIFHTHHANLHAISRATEIKRCLVFVLLSNVLIRFYGIYIILKWLIKVPGHIAILFRWFLELRFFCQNLDPWPFFSSPFYFKNARNCGIIFGNIIFISEKLKISKNQKPCATIVTCFCFVFWNSCSCFLILWFYNMLKSWNREKSKTRNGLRLVSH